MKSARIHAGKSQGEVARYVSVSQPTIFNWEAGTSTPNDETIEKLNKLLGPFWKHDGHQLADDLSEAGPAPFGVWVNRLRQEQGLTVPELASLSGVAIPTIYAIEGGRISNPRSETVKKLEKALKSKVPEDTAEQVREESTVEGLGALEDFNPHIDSERPAQPGIYVLYDVSERPIYVGEGANVKKRIREHQEKFWFKEPIVQTAAFIQVDNKDIRTQMETILIKFMKSHAVINKQNVER